MTAALGDLRAACGDRRPRPGPPSLIPFGTIPEAGKLDHYAALGVTETVLHLPSAGRDDVLRTLDGYVAFIER